MPRYPDLVIFVLTTDNNRRQIKLITLPLAHACGVKIGNNAHNYIITGLQLCTRYTVGHNPISHLVVQNHTISYYHWTAAVYYT